MPTISGFLRLTARRVPETVALKFAGRMYTHAALDAEIDRAAHALAGLDWPKATGSP